MRRFGKERGFQINVLDDPVIAESIGDELITGERSQFYRAILEAAVR